MSALIMREILPDCSDWRSDRLDPLIEPKTARPIGELKCVICRPESENFMYRFSKNGPQKIMPVNSPEPRHA